MIFFKHFIFGRILKGPFAFFAVALNFDSFSTDVSGPEIAPKAAKMRPLESLGICEWSSDCGEAERN
jgi:hypothetical protein